MQSFIKFNHVFFSKSIFIKEIIWNMYFQMTSSDKDFRFMATNDLMAELQKDSIKLDDDSERKVSSDFWYKFNKSDLQNIIKYLDNNWNTNTFLSMYKWGGGGGAWKIHKKLLMDFTYQHQKCCYGY